MEPVNQEPVLQQQEKLLQWEALTLQWRVAAAYCN